MENRHVKEAELLSPAGSFESLKAALSAGADAVYMGGSRFGARAFAENAGEEEYLKAIDYVHRHGRRLYLTLNTLLKPREMERELYAYVEPMYRQGLDAVIIQDAGVAAFLRREFPGLPLHASTQMTITGPDGAAAAGRMGFSRVVPARELSLPEIRAISQETGMELEVFIHGALCYCYSGQCLMSSLIGGRSGNRGRCAGTCRLPYQADDRKGGFLPECDALSLKDLCGIGTLPELLKAGVYSFKIEGRMKSPLYAAGVTSVYREYLDRYLEEGKEGYQVSERDVDRLRQIFDRGFTDRYFTGHNGQEMMSWKVKPAYREIPKELVEELTEKYIRRECVEEIEGSFSCRAGEEASLSVRLSGQDKTVRVTGTKAQPAQKRAVTEEEFRKNLLKTGNTPFRWKSLKVESDGNSFYSMGEVNALRRRALLQLEEVVTGRFRRELPGKTPDDQDRTGQTSVAAEKPLPRVLVYVEKQEQLAAALREARVEGIILDSECGALPGRFQEGIRTWSEFAARCHEAGKKAFLSFPYIFRIQSRVEWKENLPQIRELPMDGYLVRNIDEAEFLRKAELPGMKIAESSLYAMNPEAREEWKRTFGIDLFMAPWEEKTGELKGLDIREEGLLLYGRLPMMITAGCVQKNFGGCRKIPGMRSLQDRRGEIFPVACRCATCCNVIYNSYPLSLLGCREDVRALSPAVFRLNFTVETEEETERVLKEVLDVFVDGKKDHDPEGPFTRGHFRRGVE